MRAKLAKGNVEVFGATAAGEEVQRIILTGGGLTASVLTWGATLQDLRLEGHAPPLVLGFPRFEDYLTHRFFFGATAGRFANRIAQGRFELEGEEIQLDRNFLGKHHLHGGSRGIDKRIWQIADLDASSVRLELADPDGMMGYPGNCAMACTYRLEEDGTLGVYLESTCDRPTIANLTHHSYFNLSGEPTVLDHEFTVAAEAYLPVDEELIPTGEIRSLESTPFDFREPKPIGAAGALDGVIYDLNYCLSRERTGLRPVASLASRRSGVRLDVATSEPGLQFYAGHDVSISVPGLTGVPYGPCAGLCFEAQIWPDAPNHPDFPNAVLRPGETRLQQTRYRFSRL